MLQKGPRCYSSNMAKRLAPAFQHAYRFNRLQGSSSQRLFFSSCHSPRSSTTVLKKPHFNYKDIVANIDLYKSSVLRRSNNNAASNALLKQLDNLPKLYDQHKALVTKKNRILLNRSELQRQLKTAGKLDEQRKQEILQKLNEIKKTVSSELGLSEQYELQLLATCELIPNLVDDSVEDTGFTIMDYINFPQSAIQAPLVTIEEKTQYLEATLKPDTKRSHKEIGEKLKMFEFAQASRISGSSWYYLINDGALLEQALIQYALKRARASGFSMCTPPSMVKREISQACGFQPRDNNNEQHVYEIADDNAGGNNSSSGGGSGNSMVLTGTAEIPLAGFSANTLLQHKQLPRRLVGVSRSYRAEAGARGKDTKGLYRVHEFNKVELFTWCDAESSQLEFNKIVNFQKQLIESLGLTARVINVGADDLGAPAYKKFDIEAWMPGRGSWGELTSTSICTDYQSRRFHTRYVAKDNTQQFAHTLNGTAMAVPRVIVAIVENNYDAEQRCVWIPKVLRPYMDDKEKIEL